MARQARSKWAVYMDTSEVPATPLYNLVGIYTEELTLSLNPTSNEYSDVTSEVTEKVIEGYSPTIEVSTKVNPTNPVFEVVNSIRRELKTMDDTITTVLLVDLWEETNPTQLFNASIEVTSFGGKGLESLGIDYTLNLSKPSVGALGTSVLDPVAKTAVYTATSGE